jgi:hypothetical protein
VINLSLTPAEIVAIAKAMDRWPLAETPPDGWWSLQQKIKQAAEVNPAINELLDGR